MDRQIFSSMLVNAKKKSGKTTSDLVFDMRVLPTAIYRIEKAEFSFSMDKCFSYLKAVGYALQFSKGERCTVVSNNEELVAWEREVRGQISMSSFSEKIGHHRSYIRLVESESTIMSIDVVLKISEIMGQIISLVKYV